MNISLVIGIFICLSCAFAMIADAIRRVPSGEDDDFDADDIAADNAVTIAELLQRSAEDGEPPLTLNEVVALAYANAVDKGFHATPKSFGDDIALIHSEVSEALEAFRMVGCNGVSSNVPRTPNGKPEGVPSELADVVIRVADVCGKYDIDLGAAVTEKLIYNATRSYRHGGKHL